MRILSISAQKPNSTGSGVYLSELVSSFNQFGNENAVIAGITKEDSISFGNNSKFFPVYFNTDELPFDIVGMSDSMPYDSTRYRDLTPLMQKKFEESFMLQAKKAVEIFKPDIIICHHLYFLTALMREYFPKENIAAVCHGTDLRQFQKTNMQNERIKKNLQKLNCIFALNEHQKEEISELFTIPKEKIWVIGTGYNSRIFNNKRYHKTNDCINIVYAGKICEKKGVLCLLKALQDNRLKKFRYRLLLAGGYSDTKEYERIFEFAKTVSYEVKFLGKVSQEKLAEVFNNSHIFVLPSFFEGLPLVLIESLACGLKTVSTDLPGVRDWIDRNVIDNSIIFTPLPKMKNVDEADTETLDCFIEKLSEGILKAFDSLDEYIPPRTEDVSWNGVAQKIFSAINA